MYSLQNSGLQQFDLSIMLSLENRYNFRGVNVYCCRLEPMTWKRNEGSCMSSWRRLTSREVRCFIYWIISHIAVCGKLFFVYQERVFIYSLLSTLKENIVLALNCIFIYSVLNKGHKNFLNSTKSNVFFLKTFPK